MVLGGYITITRPKIKYSDTSQNNRNIYSGYFVFKNYIVYY